MVNGAWRSLVAHYLGVVGVGSSNLLAPTKNEKETRSGLLFVFERSGFELPIDDGAPLGQAQDALRPQRSAKGGWPGAASVAG